ncbi:MAG: tetratricopeptide repeat protein, partial [Leptolyngbyaceae cyanobacterium CSU_1_4]|nr:tetratricopeptide repeat protein [Leptolyngbyaceae cyanobacterium CSU_1_4]
MSSDGDSPKGLMWTLKWLGSVVTGVIAFVGLIAGFVKAIQGETELYIPLLIVICTVILSAVCFYYAWWWKPELEDKGSIIIQPPSNKIVKTQAVKVKHRKFVRRVSWVGILIVPLSGISGFLIWQKYQSLPPQETIVLVANFDGPEPQKYRVTEAIYNNLETSIRAYENAKVERLNKSLSQRDEAISEGTKRKATVVIWGDYGQTSEVVPVNAKFTVLRSPSAFPDLELAANNQKTKVSKVAELNDFSLQTRLSEEMSYLTLFTLGLVQYSLEKDKDAVDLFTNALKIVEKVPSPSLDKSYIYFHRGNSHILLKHICTCTQKDYELAIEDYEKAVQLRPDFTNAYINLGLAYDRSGNVDEAIKNYDQAIKLNPNASLAYNNRGIVYVRQGNYSDAIANYNKAIKNSPNFGLAYFNRGLAYADQLKYKEAIDDYNQS